MSESAPEHEKERWQQMVGYVLHIRDTAEERGATARVRHGLNEHSEHRAYGEILSFSNSARTDDTALLRSAAIIASHPKIPQGTLPLGQSFRLMSSALANKGHSSDDSSIFRPDPSSPDAIGLRLEQLPDQRLDEATLTLNRILTLGEALNVPVDYFALTKLLLRWGNGLTRESRAERRRPLREYYRPFSARKSINESAEQE